MPLAAFLLGNGKLLSYQFSALAVFAALGLKRPECAMRAAAAGGLPELFHVVMVCTVELNSPGQLKM